jgi:hypothetical protein
MGVETAANRAGRSRLQAGDGFDCRHGGSPVARRALGVVLIVLGGGLMWAATSPLLELR